MPKCKRCDNDLINTYLDSLCGDCLDKLEDENRKLRTLINDFYPAIAGMVIAALKTGEEHAKKCGMIIAGE